MPGATTEDRVRLAAASRDPVAALRRLAAGDDADPYAALRALARLQDGQFATVQASAAGVTRHGLARLATAGQVVNVRRGVWRWTTVPGVADAAVTAWLSCWPLGVVSHGSAAHHHGLVADRPAVPEVTVPHGGASRAPSGVQVHVTRSLPTRDRLRVAGVTYTSLARTVCDLATAADTSATLGRVDDAVAAGASRRWLHDTAIRLVDGRDGVALVRDATAPGAAAEFRSWLERTAAGVFAAADLPPPRWNVPVRDRRGRIGIVDCLWEPTVVAELEGLRFHTTPAQRRRDARRFNRLADAGFVVRRFTWRDVVERPDEVVDTIRRALAHRARR